VTSLHSVHIIVLLCSLFSNSAPCGQQVCSINSVVSVFQWWHSQFTHTRRCAGRTLLVFILAQRTNAQRKCERPFTRKAQNQCTQELQAPTSKNPSAGAILLPPCPAIIPPFPFLYFLSLVLFLSLPFSALPFPSLYLPPCNQPRERCRLPQHVQAESDR